MITLTPDDLLAIIGSTKDVKWIATTSGLTLIIITLRIVSKRL